MATDKTPPRNRLIATIALITLCSLVAIKFIVTSYFLEMIEADRLTKKSKPEELWTVRAEQQKSLESSPKPIDQAMKEMAEPVRHDLIAPKQSEDTGPLLGWAKSPKALPKPPENLAPAPTIAPAMDSDAGHAGDGGKPADRGKPADGGKPAPTATTDGGVAP